MPDAWDDIVAKSGLAPSKPSYGATNGHAKPASSFTASLANPRVAGALTAALESAKTNIANTALGRNNQLNAEAANLYSLAVGNNLMSETDLHDWLYATACEAGLHVDDNCGPKGIEDTIRSGFRAGRDKYGPRDLSHLELEPQVTEGDLPGWPDANGHKNGAEFKPDENEEFDWGGVDGGQFILDIPKKIPALWGAEERVLWAKGESLMIAGGQGLGKTTLAGEVVRALLFGDDVLGLPIEQIPEGQKILYLAMDRPRQIARSLNRQFDETDRETLSEKLIVRPGPPIADMATQPGLLPAMAEHFGASIVFVDSLKDAVLELTDDRIAGGWNRARQTLLAAGVDLCELHHNVKHKSGENWSLSDVYGSNWITAGVGSVIMLTGDPGDPIIGFRHIKQPSDEVGPYQLTQDRMTGHMSIQHEMDLVVMALEHEPDGLTAKTAATILFDTERPSKGEIEKARRRLVKLAERGLLTEDVGWKGGAPGANQTAWHPTLKEVPFDVL